MANTVIFYSVNDGVAHQARLFNDAGAQVGGIIAATTGAAGTYKYTFTVPGATPAGAYSFAGYRTSNGRLRSQGEFYWNGTDIVHTEVVELTVAQVQTAVGTALTSYGAATTAQVTAVGNAVAALNNLSSAQVQTAVGVALGTYDAVTQADLDACCDAILLDIAALNDLSAADIQAELVTYDGATQADLNTAQSTITSAITAAAGLTPAQLTLVQLIRDLLEADEVYNVTSGTGTAQKLLKGTATVLVDKNVTTSTPCDISTSIIEV